MQDQDRLWKTEAGREEMRSRALKLRPALRSTLLLVDGQRSVAELRQLAVGLHAPEAALDQLSSMGLIANTSDVPVSAGGAPAVETLGQFLLLSELCTEAVRQHLGLRGFFMQLKIERCAAEGDIVALLPQMRDAIAKGKGQPIASQWFASVNAAAGLKPVAAAGAA